MKITRPKLNKLEILLNKKNRPCRIAKCSSWFSGVTLQLSANKKHKKKEIHTIVCTIIDCNCRRRILGIYKLSHSDQIDYKI